MTLKKITIGVNKDLFILGGKKTFGPLGVNHESMPESPSLAASPENHAQRG